MIWLVTVWVLCGAASGMLTFGSFQYEYGEVSSKGEDAGFAAFMAFLGPMGLVVSAACGGRYGWRYWRNGRKTQAQVRREALARAGQTFGQLNASMFAFSQSLTTTSAHITRLIESLEPPPVEEVHTPDPVIGWRWWSLDPLTMTLQGAVTDWESGIMRAKHDPNRGTFSYRSHTASPHAGCLCGVNALKPEAVAPYLGEDRGGVDVFGRVALTGVVDEYELGYRAEQAEILELVILSEAPLFTRWGSHLLDEMESRYGVRPTVQSRESWLAEMEVIHGYGQEDQEDSQRTGEDPGAGAGEGASQNRLTVEHLGRPDPAGDA